MFTAHFKLTSQPFSEHTPAAALWPDERMNQGLARLHYLAEHATLGLVLGASGVGKSALLKRFLHGLRGPGTEAVYLHLTHLSSAALLKLLLCRLGEEPRRGKDRLFEQIVLAGQESLRAMLRRGVHADLLDRISVRFHLHPLTKEQTAPCH